MSKRKEVFEHPDVVDIVEKREKFGSKGAIHVFWANDIDRNPDGSVKERHGRKTALEFQSHHPELNIRLLQDYEGKEGIPSLDDYEKKTNIPKSVINAVCALSSVAFAKHSNNSVVTSVKGASVRSYFRTVELPVIMKSEHIDEVRVISRGGVWQKRGLSCT